MSDNHERGISCFYNDVAEAYIFMKNQGAYGLASHDRNIKCIKN